MTSVVLQITSGRGPLECCWVVARLVDAILADAPDAGIEAVVVESQKGTAPGTVVSAVVHLRGGECEMFCSSYEGTVQWIGQSHFRSGHRRRNWFVGVRRLLVPQVIAFSDADVKIECMRASGPGGQHVNRTESAIRATHLPTGLTAIAREDRSQSANRRLALERLSLLVARRADQQASKAQQKKWAAHNEMIRGNPVRIYEGEAFKRIS